MKAEAVEVVEDNGHWTCGVLADEKAGLSFHTEIYDNEWYYLVGVLLTGSAILNSMNHMHMQGGEWKQGFRNKKPFKNFQF